MDPTDPTPTPSPILARLEAGTLARGRWTGVTADGRRTACLLAALVPAVRQAERASACPAEVMPAWLAGLTPWIDDAGTDAAWAGHVREYAALAPHFGRLSADAALGRMALLRVLRVIVAEADRHITGASGSDLNALLDREIAGEAVGRNEYADAAEAAAAGAAARSAADAARSADAVVVANAAVAATVAVAAARFAARADAAEASDRMITGVLAELRAVLLGGAS